MSYVDALYVRDQDIVKVVERDSEGKRIFKEFPAKYTMYYTDAKGKYQSIFGDSLSRVTTKSLKEFRKEQSIYSNKKLFEADFNQTFVCLSENYLHAEAPKLNVAFFDIEVDFDPERGYAKTEDPFMPITAIAVHLQWLDTLICLAMPPKKLSVEQAKELVKDIPNTYIFDNEAEMLDTFLNIIDDADILSGWNSEGFDIPYTVNRITRVLSKDDTRRFCLWDQFPKKKEYERYGKTSTTFDLVGRVHLDSLELYKKYNYEERHSYRLDAIGEMEIGERKVPYEGSLDQLYNNDFRKFVEYNRQDCALLDKLDKKLKFIDLSNKLAHENTVLLQTTMGAVAVTEQAIINECHRRGLQVPGRKHRVEGEDVQAAGAYVAYPKKGIHNWVGSLDINSLYPSAIRALNMGPETIVGQLRPVRTDELIKTRMASGMSFAEAWEGLFGTLEYTSVINKETGTNLIIDWEDGNSTELSAAEIYRLIFESNNPFMLSANGTIFTYDKEGIIPGLLKRWYNERKELQAIHKKFIGLDSGIALPEEFHKEYKINYQSDTKITNLNWNELDKILSSKNNEDLVNFLSNNNLEIIDNKIKARNKEFLKEAIEYWDKRQLIKKINLNSLYGALLNPGCRFFDKRLGQSTTLVGRQIAKHMASTVNLIIDGEYNHIGKSIIYGDTDSVYFSAYPCLKEDIENKKIPWTKDTVIKLYDQIGQEVNSTFPQFMLDAFHCPINRGEVIKAGREIVGSKSLFITKKRYAVLYYDKEGKRQDVMGQPGKIKAMGLDLKRADTPEFMQDFLHDILEKVLTGSEEKEILELIKEFRIKFRSRPGWEKGAPKSVNNLTRYSNLEEKKGKADMPGHVRAALNWNILKRMFGDKYSMEIVDGAKIIICKLKDNPLGFTSVAYPVDELRLPEWFKELPFDHDKMESTIIDNKIDNLLGTLNWDLRSTEERNSFNSFFSFD